MDASCTYCPEPPRLLTLCSAARKGKQDRSCRVRRSCTSAGIGSACAFFLSSFLSLAGILLNLFHLLFAIRYTPENQREPLRPLNTCCTICRRFCTQCTGPRAARGSESVGCCPAELVIEAVDNSLNRLWHHSTSGECMLRRAGQGVLQVDSHMHMGCLRDVGSISHS